MKSKLYTLEDLNNYVIAMKSYVKTLGYEYDLIINTSFTEMWDGLVILDYNDDNLDNDFLKFWNFRNSYIEENNMNYKTLALSFIKSGKYDKFLDAST
jgi:hypothetical protein